MNLTVPESIYMWYLIFEQNSIYGKSWYRIEWDEHWIFYGELNGIANSMFAKFC